MPWFESLGFCTFLNFWGIVARDYRFVDSRHTRGIDGCLLLLSLKSLWASVCDRCAKSPSWQYQLTNQETDSLRSESRRKCFYDKVLIFKLLSPNLHLPLTASSKDPVWMNVHETRLDELAVVQLQTEDCSLLDIKLPQHFPGSYSQLSLMKAITQTQRETLAVTYRN